MCVCVCWGGGGGGGNTGRHRIELEKRYNKAIVFFPSFFMDGKDNELGDIAKKVMNFLL